jgi:5-methylcytosine-specific restriction endonuclease McrA
MTLKKHKHLLQLRRQAYLNQNGNCFYCQLPIWERGGRQHAKELRIPIRLAKHLRCTAEHLIPQANGGLDTPENIVAACVWCNQQRHAGRPDDAPDPLTYRAQVAECMAGGQWHPTGLAAVVLAVGDCKMDL